MIELDHLAISGGPASTDLFNCAIRSCMYITNFLLLLCAELIPSE